MAGRATFGMGVVWAAWGLAVAASLGASEPSVEAPPPTAFELRAELADVAFVDRRQGWAVGDLGLIWHTADGGATWQKQASGVSCRLETVQMLPDGRGWAAGGWALPYSAETQGVVLHTEDGGRQWQLAGTAPLPWIHHLQFVDAQRGWALGYPTELAPGALFSTTDGGRTWNPRIIDAPGPWRAADFASPRGGVLLGSGGRVALLDAARASRGQAPPSGIRRPSRVKIGHGGQGWAVGEGGLLWTTSDGGRAWSPPAGRLPAAAARFDLAALAVVGRNVWAAGSPGSHVLASHDGGRAWQLHATGQWLPLAALSFVDEQHGWAVGALGTILVTVDGGRSWKVCRQGAPRVAALGIFADAEAVPLEVFARLSAGDGYPTIVHLVARREFDDPRADPTSLARVRAALAGVGASAAGTAWQFPVRQRGLHVSVEQLQTAWGRAASSPDPNLLEAHLVDVLQVWRPEIVLTHATGPDAEPLETLVQLSVLRAVERLGRDQRRPPSERADSAAAWQVQRVYAALPPGRMGPISLSTAAYLPRLGGSLADAAASGRGLLRQRYEPPPDAIGFQLLLDRTGAAGGERDDFLAGLKIGELAAPVLSPRGAADVADLHRAATQQRNVRALLARSAKQPAADARWLAEVGGLLAELDRAAAAELLFQLAHGYQQQGRWDLAAETFGLLAESYADQPLAGPAMVWLIQYQASAEARFRAAARPAQEIQQTAASVSLGLAATRAPDGLAASQRLPAASLPQAELGRQQRLAALAAQLARSWPALAAGPNVRLPLAAADRAAHAEQAAQTYAAILRTRPRDAWSACAAAELWALSAAGPPDKPLYTCRRAASRPRLDGRLEEDLWQAAAPLALRSPWRDDHAWPATVRFSHDEQFLYLAVEAERAPYLTYEDAAGNRPRDANLERHDRVEVCLDIDRDWVTSYQLAVDARGWTTESCWGDRSWNPSWYVARRLDDHRWTIEAAIAWQELAAAPPASGTIWGLGAQRTAPGAGFQSWTRPAAVDIVPEGFGLLRFE